MTKFVRFDWSAVFSAGVICILIIVSHVFCASFLYGKLASNFWHKKLAQDSLSYVTAVSWQCVWCVYRSFTSRQLMGPRTWLFLTHSGCAVTWLASCCHMTRSPAVGQSVVFHWPRYTWCSRRAASWSWYPCSRRWNSARRSSRTRKLLSSSSWASTLWNRPTSLSTMPMTTVWRCSKQPGSTEVCD